MQELSILNIPDENCRAFGSSGETSSVDDDLWLSAQAGYKPVLECCGGTELGAMYVGGNLVQPQAFAAFSTVGMTFRIYILDDSNNPYVSNRSSADIVQRGCIFHYMIGRCYLESFSFAVSNVLQFQTWMFLQTS